MAENVEMIRPINLPEAQQLSENDVFILDSETGGVRKIPKNKVYTPVDDTLSESGEAADAKVTGEKIDELKAETALIQNPVGNKSGELVSFSDGADMPAISVIAHIEPIQSGTGTPSPDNVRAISGWESVNVFDTGVNVWDEEMEEGFFSTSNGEKVSRTDILRSTNMTSCKPNTDIYVKVSGACSFMWYGANKEYLGYRGTVNANTVVTIPDNVHYFNFGISKENYGHDAYNHDISINYPSTDHDYHAYNGTTTTVNLGRTVYGGTLDVVSGELSVDRAMVALDGTTSWTMGTTSTMRYFNASMSALDATPWDTDILSNIATRQESGFPYCQITGDKKIRLAFALSDTDYDSVSKVQALLTQTSLTAVYNLATPQTYTLTPTEVNTLLGENNVWADSGDVSINYRRDITIALSELEQAIISLGANV